MPNIVVIMIDKTQTVDYVRRQIQAEYAIRYLIDKELEKVGIDAEELNIQTSRIMCISQLYDEGDMSMPFNSIIGDLVSFDDTIIAVNAIGGNNNHTAQLMSQRIVRLLTFQIN